MNHQYALNFFQLHLFSDNAIAAGKDQAWPSDVKYWTKKVRFLKYIQYLNNVTLFEFSIDIYYFSVIINF